MRPGFRRAAAALAAAALATACSDAGGPATPALDGTWTMVAVNGAPLPAVVGDTPNGEIFVTTGSLAFHSRGRVTDSRTVRGQATVTTDPYRLAGGDTIIVDRTSGITHWSDTGRVVNTRLTLRAHSLVPGASPDLDVAYDKVVTP